MSITYKDKYVDQLIFAIFNSPIDPSMFTIFKTDRIVKDNISVDLSIIGESHLIALKMKDRPEFFFAEAVFCNNNDIDKNAEAIRVFDSSQDKISFSRQTCNLNYQFTAMVMNIYDSKEQLKTELAKPSPDYSRLSYKFFPEIYSDELPVPSTVIDYKYVENVRALIIKTLHLYPNTGEFVKTESNFAFLT